MAYGDQAWMQGIANNASTLQGNVLNPQQLAGTQPAPYADFGAVPYLSPSTYGASSYTPTGYDASSYTPTGYTPSGYGAAMYDPTSVSTDGAYIDPQQSRSYADQTMGLLGRELNPGFQNQQRALAQSMAARGLTNSGAGAQAQGELFGQQDAALAQGELPILSQGFGYSQSDLANNANVNQNANLADAGYANAASSANARALNTAGQFNAQAGNTAGQFNAGAANTAGQFNAQAGNAAGQFNAGAANTAGQFNSELQQSADAANAGASNATNMYNDNNYLGVTTGDQTAYNNWLAGMGAYGSQYGNGVVGQYASSFQPANPTILGSMGNAGVNNARAGQTAYNASAANSGGVGAALSNIADNSGLPKTSFNLNSGSGSTNGGYGAYGTTLGTGDF